MAYDGEGKLYNPLYNTKLEMYYITQVEEQLLHGITHLEYWKSFQGSFRNSKKHGKGKLVLAGDYVILG